MNLLPGRPKNFVPFPTGARNISLAAQNPTRLLIWYPRLFPKVYSAAARSIHSLPPTAQVNNAWNYICFGPYAFMVCTAITVSLPSRTNVNM
jgi:hypothetical protein